MALIAKENKIFATVLSDGKIHVTVPEGTENAVTRKYKTSDGVEGEKTELIYNELIGRITNVDIREGNFGAQLYVTVEDDGDDKPIALVMGSSSSYGEDFMKKLPNVDLTKTVKIVPYAFEDDNKKLKKGVTIWQHNGKENVKIGNYYYDADKKKLLHGFPEVPAAIEKIKKEGKKVPSAKWRAYFSEVEEFLIEETRNRFGIVENTGDELDELANEINSKLED